MATNHSEGYRSPLETRYASAEMRALWSARTKFGTWRRLWLALAEAEHELGLAEVTPAALAALREHLDDVDLETAAPLPAVVDPSPVEQLESGLVLGIHDYFRKLELPRSAVVGVSGGVDSAVTAHLAALALGPDQVLGIAMPGPFSSEHSVEDALELCRNLGIEVRVVDIRPIYEAYLGAFRSLFGERDDYGLAQQNVQSRIRGATLIGNGPEVMNAVSMVGNDLELDGGVGVCGKDGQSVPVGVGQPTLKVDEIVVGGTQA